MKLLETKPLRSMNAYYRVYEDAPLGYVYELVSYCTPVVWASMDKDGDVDCIVYGPDSKCSRTTARQVSTFVREVLHIDAPIPSKKTIDELHGNKVLYTYPHTNYTTETDLLGDFGEALGIPLSGRFALRSARKSFYNGAGYFVPGGEWRNNNA